MANSSSGPSTLKNATFIYFWLGLLTGALVIIMTMMIQSAIRDGQTSLFRAYDTRTITDPQTYDSITDPQTYDSITDPQTSTSITDPQTYNRITDPQTLTR